MSKFKYTALCGKPISKNHVELYKHQMQCEDCAKVTHKQWNAIIGNEEKESQDVKHRQRKVI